MGLSCRSRWQRILRRRSTAARLLRSWVIIPPGTWIFVCCQCCVLSGRDLCDELINRPEESYRLWCVVVCDLETTKILVNEEEAKAHQGAIAPTKKKKKKKGLFMEGPRKIIKMLINTCLLTGLKQEHPEYGGLFMQYTLITILHKSRKRIQT